MREQYPIRLPDDSVWSAEERQKDSEGWQRALHATRGLRKPAICLCRGAGYTSTRLYSHDRNGTLHMAKYPDTGHHHQADCLFFAPRPEESGRQGYDTSALSVERDGSVKVSLGFPLTRRTTEPQESGSVPAHRSGRRRATMSELGLLHLLWEEAGLQSWRPWYGNRSWGTVRNLLLEAIENIHRSSDALSSRLVIVPGMFGPNLHAEVQQDFLAKVTRSRLVESKVERLILIGELHSLNFGPRQARMNLTMQESQHLQLFSSKALAESLLNRFTGMTSILNGTHKGDHAIALLIGEIRPRDNRLVGDVVAGALMATTNKFIPYASSYERRVALKLVHEQRAFLKPLRFEASEALLPDFVLHDAGPADHPMEVYGRDDPEYLARKAEKREQYRELYGSDGCWEWEVNPSQPEAIPDFPPRRQLLRPRSAVQGARS